MQKANNIIKQLILFFIGMGVIQFGVALFLKTNIGSDPFTVFTQGIASMLNKTGFRDLSLIKLITGNAQVTTGVANIIILVVLLVIIVIFDKSRINIGTLICVIGVGPIIDLAFKFVSHFPIDSYNIIIKSLLVALGCFIIATGFSVLSASNIGVAPNDIIPFIIQDKTKLQYRWIRMSLDAILLVIGFILGGTIGIGTVIAMILIGPFIQFCLPYGERFVSFIVTIQEKKEEEESIQKIMQV